MQTAGRFIASARLISLLTLLSRIAGVVREGVFTYYFGASELMSAFRIGFMAPNLARRLFGEGALSAAMVPALTRSIQERGDEPSRRFFGSLLTVLTIALLILVAAIEVMLLIWQGLHRDLALELAAILMPYAAFVCVVAVAGGVLNVRHHFAVPAAAPILLNLAIIGSALGGASWFGWSGVALLRIVCGGILAAGLLQIFLTAGALGRVAFFPIFGGGWSDPQVWYVARLLGPMMLGMSAVQINSLLDYVIAYLFVTHNGDRVGPAVLGYAQYLYQLPLGVFGIAFATALFPQMSRHAAAGDHAAYADDVRRGIRYNLFIGLPSCVGLVLIARPLVAALYQRGEFDAWETQRVAAALVMYCLGLPAYFTQHMLARAFYSLHETRTPARIAAWMVVLNLTLNLLLVFVMEERGLALSTSFCAYVQVAWLSIRLSRLAPAMQWRPILDGAARMALAALAMAVVLILIDGIFFPSDTVGRAAIIQLAVEVAAGLATFGLAAKLLRIDELATLLGRERSPAVPRRSVRR